MDWISNNFGFDDNEINFQKVSINQLSSDLNQVVIKGVIIGKQEVRRISRKKESGSERSVLNFTLRDSQSDSINAVCWGEESAIGPMSSSFTIGDVVRIKNPQVMAKQPGEMDEKFKPSVTSQYHLNISPIYSEIAICDGEEKEGYERLLHCTNRTSSDILNLADIVYNSQNADGLTVTLLIAINEIGKLQIIKTKDGREVKKLSLSVFDETHFNFPIIIWDDETANFILKTCGRRSVVLISDIKVQYNKFIKQMAGTATSATIFTPEPEITDGRVLYQYAMKTALSHENEDGSLKTHDSTAVYTVEQIIKFMNSPEVIADDVGGIINVFITEFDIDGATQISTLRCPGCLQMIKKSDDKCINGACEIGSGMTNLPPEQMYDLSISLADSTGSLSRCHLAGQAAQNLFGAPVQEILSLSDDAKTNLKWKYLFEKFKVQIKVSLSSNGSTKPILRISHIEKAEV